MNQKMHENPLLKATAGILAGTYAGILIIFLVSGISPEDGQSTLFVFPVIMAVYACVMALPFLIIASIIKSRKHGLLLLALALPIYVTIAVLIIRQ